MTQEESIKIIEKIKRGIMIDAKAPNIDVRNIATLKVEAIETVLNMLKEKDKYIEFYKNGLEREIESNRENIMEIIKKDKQIDLMSRAIDNYDSQLAINTFRDKEHVKQYFAGLVEKE